MSGSYTIYRHTTGDFLGEAFYDWRGHAFQEFARFLRSQGKEVKLENRDSFEVTLGRSDTIQLGLPDSLAIIKNDQNGDYYVLDCHDLIKTAEADHN